MSSDEAAPRASSAATIIPGRGEQRFYERQDAAAADPARQYKIDRFMAACEAFEALTRYRGLMSGEEWNGVATVLSIAAGEIERRRQGRESE
jgi:hypothetical protein